MKTQSELLITSELIPTGKDANNYLNALQLLLGGRRGYGGKRYHGHWLLTKATMAEYDKAVEFLKVPTPETDAAWGKYQSTEWTAEQAIEVSRNLERKLSICNKKTCQICNGSGFVEVVPGQIHACDCKRTP